MAGHLDMYTLAGNEQPSKPRENGALGVELVRSAERQQMQRVLQEEYAGWAKCSPTSTASRQEQYLRQAQRFDKKAFFDPLAAHRDELKGLHVNTHVPSDCRCPAIRTHGREALLEHRRLFLGRSDGRALLLHRRTSNFEHWRSEPGVLSTELSPLTAEDCCVYNMLKLTRHVFAWSPRASHMDYYERVLFNHRMGTIDPETGTTVYHLRTERVLKIYAKPSTPSGAAAVRR